MHDRLTPTKKFRSKCIFDPNEGLLRLDCPRLCISDALFGRVKTARHVNNSRLGRVDRSLRLIGTPICLLGGSVGCFLRGLQGTNTGFGQLQLFRCLTGKVVCAGRGFCRPSFDASENLSRLIYKVYGRVGSRIDRGGTSEIEPLHWLAHLPDHWFDKAADPNSISCASSVRLGIMNGASSKHCG